MKYRGINYDIGTKTVTGRLTRETFDVNTVTKEMEIIKNELHCNAIRISGLPIERISGAAEIALKMGLHVWFSPSFPYGNRDDTLKYIIEASSTAEKLRVEYSNVIFVAACELSLFTGGFIKGDTGEKRMANLFSPVSLVKNLLGIKRRYNLRLNKFLLQAVAEIRKSFHGQITYASGTWEKVDWKMFDITGIDHYRASYNKRTYTKELRKYKRQGKPISVMEFGYCSYKGAEEKGPIGWAIADWKKNPPELTSHFIRDEAVQSKNILEILDILEQEEVYAAFVFTFVFYNYVYNDDPKYDLDMASFGIVKAMPPAKDGYYKGLSWIPKLAFFELGKYYSRH